MVLLLFELIKCKKNSLHLIKFVALLCIIIESLTFSETLKRFNFLHFKKKVPFVFPAGSGTLHILMTGAT